LGSKSHKYEEAAEHFTKAAKQYQLGKAYIDAGNAFLKASECYSNCSYGAHQIATCYIQAAQSFSKQDLHIGIDAMRKGLFLLSEEGKFSLAAKYEKELAEMFETLGDFDNAIKHYEIASEYFGMEGSNATGAGCLEKIIPLVAEQGDYHRAIELIEKICDTYSTSLAKHYIKELCLKGGILYLCIPDLVGAHKGRDKWAEKYSEFRGSREYQFLSQLIAAKEDSEMFKRAVDEWQSISSLDKFKDRFLKKALEKLLDDEEEEENWI